MCATRTFVNMRFADWMIRESLDDEEVAQRVRSQGVKCDRTMIGRYRRGVRRPEWDVIGALREISRGDVTADDFQVLSEAAQ